MRVRVRVRVRVSESESESESETIVHNNFLGVVFGFERKIN